MLDKSPSYLRVFGKTEARAAPVKVCSRSALYMAHMTLQTANLPPWAKTLTEYCGRDPSQSSCTDIKASAGTETARTFESLNSLVGYPSWLQRLPYAAALEEQIDEILLENLARKSKRTPRQALPALKSRKAISDSQVSSLCFAAAYGQTLATKRSEILSGEDFDLLWAALKGHSMGDNRPGAPHEAVEDIGLNPSASPSHRQLFVTPVDDSGKKSTSTSNTQLASDGQTGRIEFGNFCKLKDELPAKFKRYFKTSIFLALGPDARSNSIPIVQFVNYVLRHSSLLNARVDFANYDGDMDGYLNEDELQSYLADLLPLLNLNSLKPSFHKFYLCTASRKLFFYLDALHRNRIAIRDLILSPILTELFLLREHDMPRELERSNWFSANSAMRVYTQFMALDTDRNGMLSQQELSKYSNGSLTAAYISRVFEECQTYNGEMDYRTYLDFVLANEALPFSASYHPSSITTASLQTPPLDSSRSEQSTDDGTSNSGSDAIFVANPTLLPFPVLNFHFKLLDISHKGFLDEHDLLYFLKDVTEKLSNWGAHTPPLDILINEIFDLVNPAEPAKVTLKDLSKPGVAGIVIGLLIDVNAFSSYENRESS